MKDQQNKIDLGLSALLEEPAAAESGVAVSQSSNVSPEIAQTEQPKRSLFEQLVVQQKWQDLSDLSEAEMQHKGESAEMRLWWILAQHKLAAVPSAILAAPLEQITRTLGADSPLTERCLASQLLIEIGRELAAKGEYQLGIGLLCREQEIAAEGSTHLLEAITKERASIQQQPQFGREKQIKERLSALDAIEKKTRQSNTTVSITQPAVAISLKQERNIAQSSGKVRSGSGLGVFILLALCALLPVAAFLLFFYDSEHDLAPAIAMITLEPATTIEAPLIERVKNFNNLRAVFYDLESKKAHTASSTAVAHNDSSPEVQVKTPPSRTRETINTDSPLEPTLPRTQRASGNAESKSNAPAYNPLFDKVPSNNPVDAEDFGTGKYFVVVAKTQVMSSPSFRTKAVDELQRGDRVLAQARIGSWLKLKSRSGVPGYILIQDVVERE